MPSGSVVSSMSVRQLKSQEPGLAINSWVLSEYSVLFSILSMDVIVNPENSKSIHNVNGSVMFVIVLRRF